ncbi:hypothetical protein PORY_000560 [Pneumocystis oryctolagi]|uniref:Uncharacterized protein n=1 Tax=Pneumocystis oryctolagi TaxID=42067 RepID=A0ACB7CFK4_9ASCO|nr:hypothetical protein PORY_000560 [Pneumocystis oryctolagi]
MLSAERPFGIYLWPIFGKIWEKIMGYSVDEFVFVPGKTFLSSWTEVISSISLYYVVIFLGQLIMKPFSPKKLNIIFQIYNLFLSILSGCFFLLLFEQMFPVVWKHGLYYSICDAKSWTQPAVTIYYLNYLIKYLELMDTVFLFLKKKRLQFLHCYHHGATIFLCFAQLIGQTPVSYIPIFLNLGVHVVMYYYYYLCACGIRVWWKKCVTLMQIVQFILDLLFVYFATYTYFAYNYFPYLPNFGNCSGKEFAALIGCFFLSSYLFLFIGFYAATYKSKVSTENKSLNNKNVRFNQKLSDIDFKDLNAKSIKSTGINGIGMTTRQEVLELIEKLISNIVGVKNENKLFYELRDKIIRMIKELSFPAANQFEIKRSCYGLVEKFDIVSKEDHSAILKRLFNKLFENDDNGLVIDVLSLILSLSDNPFQKKYLFYEKHTEKPSEIEKVCEIDDIPYVGEHWKVFNLYENDDDDDGDDITLESSLEKSQEIEENTIKTIPLESISINDQELDSIEDAQYWRSISCQNDVKRITYRLNYGSDVLTVLNEINVVREIIFMMQGNETVLFLRNRDDIKINNHFAMSQISHTMFLSSLEWFLERGLLLNKIRNFVSNSYKNCLENAFVSCVDDFLGSLDFFLSYCQTLNNDLEHNRTLTMLYFQDILDKILDPYIVLSDIISRIDGATFKTNICDFLNMLFYKAKFYFVFDKQTFLLITAILSSLLETYLKPLELWFSRGELLDFQGFFIVKSTLKPNDRLWLSEYQLSLASDGTLLIPDLLKRISQKSLLIGRLKKILMLIFSESKITFRDINENIFQKLKSDYDARLKLFSAKINDIFLLDSLFYEIPTILKESFEYDYLSYIYDWIDENYHTSMKDVLHALFYNVGLEKHLNAMFEIYCMYNNCYIIDFINSIFEKMDQEKKWCDKYVLQDLVENSMKCSTIDLDLITIKVQKDLKNGNISNCFYIYYKLPLPLSLIIDSSSQFAYYKIFDFMFQLLKNRHDVKKHLTFLELQQTYKETQIRSREFSIQTFVDPIYLDVRVIGDVIVSGLSSEIEEVRNLSESCVQIFYDTLVTILGSNELIDRIPLFHSLANKFCHACYKEHSYDKSGGVLGIKILIKILNKYINWITNHELDFIKALLFVLKDTSPEIPSTYINNAVDTIMHILKLCNNDTNESECNNEKQRKFTALTALLIAELSNPSTIVRETVQSAFRLLSKLQGTELHELLKPVQERLLQPIFIKPLRALPFGMQFGHIDAITFCLSLKPSFLEFSDELIRLLHEALALADAEDEALVSANKTSQYKNASALINLRIVCIKVLSIAISCPEFSTPAQNQTRARIISVFFKSLYSKSNEIVEVANKGLKQVLAQNHKLPKDQLQAGLRPILMNLSDHKRLTVAGLEGLARLLELLTSYFKVEIGKKLLDHLRVWADPSILQMISGSPLEEQHCITIISAILNIFHLLPPSANTFLEELVTIVIDLEIQLRRTLSSPLRKPLLSFLNKYPSDSWNYFAPKLDQQKYSLFFSQLLNVDISEPLRTYISSNLDSVISYTFLKDDSHNNIWAIVSGVTIIKALVFDNKSLIISNSDLIRVLLDFFSIPLLQSLINKGDEYYLQVKLIIQTLTKILKFYIRKFPSDLKVIFHCFEVASMRNLVGFNVFDELISEIIISNKDIQYKKDIIMLCLNIITNKQATSYWKTYLLRKIVNPVLLMSYNRHESLVDKLLIDTIHIKIWKTALNDFGVNLYFPSDSIKNEIIQMTASIIKYSTSYVNDEAKEDIVKFSWNYIKLDDIIVKYSSYVLLAYFAAFYETFPKITAQVYIALLKSSHSEGKHLVKQALDILAPVLSTHIPSTDIKYPDWIKQLRCVVVEENNNVPLLINAFQFIIRHETLFYQFRELFIPQMVASLPKLGFTQNANVETRIITIELIELIAKWEQRRLELSQTTINFSKLEEPPGNDKLIQMDIEPIKLSNKDYVPSMVLQDAIITYLARIACSSPESYSKRGISSKVIPLIRQLMNPYYWRDVTIKLSFFEKVLKHTEISKKTIGQYCIVLEILSIVVEFQSNEWISENIHQFQDLLEKAIKIDSEQIHKILKPILTRLFLNLSDDKENSPGLEFKTFITNIIHDNLQNSLNLISTISILSTIPDERSDILDPFIPFLIKVFQKISKDHLTFPVQQNRTLSQTNVTDNNYTISNFTTMDPEIMVTLIENFIAVIKKRTLHLGDQRRLFLATLAQLVEKSPSSQLCFTILEILKEWVIEQQTSFPTIKEKAALLLKMISFETRGDSVLHNKFLSLIVSIFENPAIARTELTMRLEQAFMIGTKAEDISIRNHFMDVFNKSIPKNVYTRLNYILGVQKWESLANSFWISQANQLLIGSIVVEEKIFILEADRVFRTLTSDKLLSSLTDETLMMDSKIDSLILNHETFLQSINKLTAENIIIPLSYLQFLELNVSSQLWSDVFTVSWNSIGKKDRHELSKSIVTLLANNYHSQQMDKRPNVVKTILNSLARNASTIKIPPHLVKYLGKTFNAWYEALELLEEISSQGSKNMPTLRESTLDALAEMYATLQEDDMFYGLWRRRCQYLETNTAISYEQNGMWDKAQHMYENAQIKARTGVLPFSESEYTLWEDHWLLCAQKLQQWDILTDLAKQENYSDLLLECAWRVTDWTTNRETLEASIKSLMDIPTPRRYIFEAFTVLQKTQTKLESIQEFIRICDEGMQLSLRKWYQLPVVVSNSHIPLLQNFQQYVELHEASQIYASLSSTNTQNLEAKSKELKNILGTWRERLPNIWDDINTWSDLVAWRQLIFSAINREYLPLISSVQQQTGTSGNNSSATSFAYRGYHEIAWIINRFAHVSRKHQLADVCINQLTKIYTLPNIEIQEAFLKLREQAKCHYQNNNELSMGLEVISNTNLMYFGQQQKAEFFTLKGMFLAKLKMNDDANQAFATAVQIDLTLSKAWAEWGQYNDKLFKENPREITAASNAVSCYLQAAGLLKNGKARKVLSRVLWLLSLDDSSGTISKAFDSYKGDISVWNWITFIPQLLTSLSHKEARHVRQILVRIAKTYPQALYFQLRTTKEDYTIIKKQAFAAAQSASKNNPISPHNQSSNSMKQGNMQDQTKTNINNETDIKQTSQISSFPNIKTENNISTPNNTVPNLQPILKTN